MCKLISSDFISENDGTKTACKTTFKPQAFKLNKDESKPVTIVVDIPEETSTGLYISRVQVEGFEPAYFTIRLTITAKEVPQIDVSKKAPRKKTK